MKLKYSIMFAHLFVLSEDILIKSPKALTFNELETLDDIFEFENVSEKIEHFDQELDLNFLKRVDSGAGFIDSNDNFKLIPCRNYFSLFKKINGKYVYSGKILYPNKFNSPTSIYLSSNGDSFISVFSRFDKKAEEYEYKLFAWLKDKGNSYKRFYLGYVNAAAISDDGSTIFGFNTDLKRGYYWKLKNDRYKLVNDSLISNRSNNPLIAINKDGSRFFILDTKLISKKTNMPIEDQYLEFDIFEAGDGGSFLNELYGFLLPATKAVADIDSTGKLITICFQIKKPKAAKVKDGFCTGVACEVENSDLPKFLVIYLNENKKSTDLLFYANINEIPNRLKIKSGINAILFGFDNYFDLYEFKLPEIKKIIPEVEKSIDCQSLLANLDDQYTDQSCN